MDQTHQQPPKPPAGFWERYTSAAHRIGVQPKVLRATIEAGGAQIRVARLGARGLLHVAASDVDAFARRLESTT